MYVCPAPTVGSLRAAPESAAEARHADARQSLPTGLQNPLPEGQPGRLLPLARKGRERSPPPPGGRNPKLITEEVPTAGGAVSERAALRSSFNHLCVRSVGTGCLATGGLLHGRGKEEEGNNGFPGQPPSLQSRQQSS